MAADDAARSAARKLDFAHQEPGPEDHNTPSDGLRAAAAEGEGLQVRGTLRLYAAYIGRMNGYV